MEEFTNKEMKEENEREAEKMQDYIEKYKELVNRVDREGIDGLKHRIQESDFFKAPASARFHMSIPGGLVRHSLNVYEALKSLLVDNEDGTYSYVIAGREVERVTEDNIIVMSLLHDLCKAGFYKEVLKWRKDENNKWESYSGYEVEDEFPFGHGEKSVYMILQYMKLEPCELYAIRWHMGFPEGADKGTFQTAVKMYPIIWALHTADMMASNLMETTDGLTELYSDLEN